MTAERSGRFHFQGIGLIGVDGVGGGSGIAPTRPITTASGDWHVGGRRLVVGGPVAPERGEPSSEAPMADDERPESGGCCRTVLPYPICSRSSCGSARTGMFASVLLCARRVRIWRDVLRQPRKVKLSHLMIRRREQSLPFVWPSAVTSPTVPCLSAPFVACAVASLSLPVPSLTAL